MKTDAFTFCCDRCAAYYRRNEEFDFRTSRNRNSRITGFSFIGNRTYLVHSQDLCDECLKDLVNWYETFRKNKFAGPVYRVKDGKGDI